VSDVPLYHPIQLQLACPHVQRGSLTVSVLEFLVQSFGFRVSVSESRGWSFGVLVQGLTGEFLN